MSANIQSVFATVQQRNPHEPEFHQAVKEVLDSIAPCLDRNPELVSASIVERLVEPERVVMFRVPWRNDKGQVQINRGFRVQFNSAIGPYKGGLRFHPSVNLGIIKFLGFEQILKNSLTTLPMGGAKGGSDFDPKGKSDAEVERFCESFMLELYRHVGQFTDVPAGDIGVGAREIGFLFGAFKRIVDRFEGVFTGKGPEWGGSLIRPEATGYGNCYFATEMLATRNDGFKGKVCLVSGAGNVAQFTLEKLNHLGAKPITVSDSDGVIIDRDGIGPDKVEYIKDLKNNRRGRIAEYATTYPKAQFIPHDPTLDHNPLWAVEGAHCAFPSATQNEINFNDAKNLVKNGVMLVSEGANMPSVPEAVDLFVSKKLLYGPAKAANAGGVATSGLEMSQNSLRLSWSRDEVDAHLKRIMVSIHTACAETAKDYGQPGNYMLGANIAGFMKVAKAMLALGLNG